jgi:hypothetical protein
MTARIVRTEIGDGTTHLTVRAYRYGDEAAREKPALRTFVDEHLAAAV